MKKKPGQLALADHEPYLATTCACGKKVGARLAHYQIVRCSRCGAFHWALQPKPFAPLVLFPWPGTAEMAKARAQLGSGLNTEH